MPATLAEFALLLLAAWGLYRLLEPLRRRIERALLLALYPSKKDIVDAEVVPRESKTKKE